MKLDKITVGVWLDRKENEFLRFQHAMVGAIRENQYRIWKWTAIGGGWKSGKCDLGSRDM